LAIGAPYLARPRPLPDADDRASQNPCRPCGYAALEEIRSENAADTPAGEMGVIADDRARHSDVLPAMPMSAIAFNQPSRYEAVCQLICILR
jgi:hypothetical protein